MVRAVRCVPRGDVVPAKQRRALAAPLPARFVKEKIGRVGAAFDSDAAAPAAVSEPLAVCGLRRGARSLSRSRAAADGIENAQDPALVVWHGVTLAPGLARVFGDALQQGGLRQ